MDFLTILLSVLLSFLLVALAGILFLLIRVKKIGNIVGTFECWVRFNSESGWTSGMARFGEEELQWFRLVGFYYGPQLRLPRGDMRISVPENLTSSPTVEVVIEANGQRIECTMASQWYNGLVSWVESGAPSPRQLF
ncbi:hypothetical protein HMPREF0044_0885 [Gleimia coleocanis DSM 15436]|uniref:DUF2550 domain-containing protein n=1 Tax=Gleimia coleocanis DSM 15436 TaxID=525245 RepID=C0W007_9ACTO|nr:DUF2550 family protein [Gleimia coleocanis]EEH63866.1 hypothetical protein HMPREF0044_0885 [Gleimia coleocanis DSM 15436]